MRAGKAAASPRYNIRMSFSGSRVVAFESRRAPEIAELIRKQGGEPFVAPALREAPLDDNREAFDLPSGCLRANSTW